MPPRKTKSGLSDCVDKCMQSTSRKSRSPKRRSRKSRSPKRRSRKSRSPKRKSRKSRSPKRKSRKSRSPKRKSRKSTRSPKSPKCSPKIRGFDVTKCNKYTIAEIKHNCKKSGLKVGGKKSELCDRLKSHLGCEEKIDMRQILKELEDEMKLNVKGYLRDIVPNITKSKIEEWMSVLSDDIKNSAYEMYKDCERDGSLHELKTREGDWVREYMQDIFEKLPQGDEDNFTETSVSGSGKGGRNDKDTTQNKPRLLKKNLWLICKDEEYSVIYNSKKGGEYTLVKNNGEPAINVKRTFESIELTTGPSGQTMFVRFPKAIGRNNLHLVAPDLFV